MIELNDRQLETLIRWYDRTVYPTRTGWHKFLGPDEEYFFDNKLIEHVFEMIGGAALTKGYILTKKAKEIVKRRAGLRLVSELLSRVNSTRPSDDLREIVSNIPFKELPQLLSCDDEYIRELAVTHMRKRQRCA